MKKRFVGRIKSCGAVAVQTDVKNRCCASAQILFSIYIAALKFIEHSSHNLTCLKLISYCLTDIATKFLMDPSCTCDTQQTHTNIVVKQSKGSLSQM